MGVDTDEICGFVQIINSFYTVPISLTIGIFMLWQNLGPSSLTLLAVMVILGPVTTFIMRKMDRSQTAQMKLKDKRMEQISEILNNVKLLKLFAWEKPFMDRVTKTRQKELIQLKSLGYWSSAIDVLWVVAPMLVAGACFTVYTLTSTNSFSAKTAFVSLSIFNLLRFPMAILPSVLTRCIRAIVSFKRLKKFLSCEELDNYRNYFSDDGIDLNDSIIHLNDCTYTWSMNEEPVLKDINIKVPKGSLIAIVGRVGSGKSSLFSALMGDMYQSRGSTKVLGSLAYVPQSAWIQNTTLK
jgi:ABC-type multidrug transport system fused ATPase/permease subunit